MVGRERVRLASRAVERQHQLRARPLPERVGPHERLDLGHELRVDVDVEVGRDALLQHAEAQVLEPVDLVLGEVLQLEIRERRAPPQLECAAQERRPLGRLRLTGLVHERLEPGEVDLRGIEHECVARGPGHEEVRPEQLTELRDRVLERRRRRPGRVLAPETVDEPLGGDRLVRPQEQQREHGPLVAAAERHDPTAVDDLERAEDPELQHAPVVTEVSDGEKSRNYALAGGLGSPGWMSHA